MTGKAHEIVMNVRNNGAEKLKGLQGGFSNAVSSGLMAGGAAFAGLGTVGGLTYGGVSAFQSQMDFEKQMSSVKAILSSAYHGEELNSVMTSLTEVAERMGATTKFTAKESAEALYYMGMAGFKSEQMLAALPSVLNLAAAGNTDLGTTADIVTDSMTAFGLKAGKIVELDGRIYEMTQHYNDMMGALVTNANTDIPMLGETLKYAAPVIGALYADGTDADKMYGAQDMMLLAGLQANAGIKASQAGTSSRALFARLASEQRNASFALQALDVDFTDDKGNVRRVRDIMGDLRSRFKEGVSVDQMLDFEEFLSGTKLHADTRRKLEGFLKHAQENGGKLTGGEKTKMAALLNGQEGMSGLLAILTASDEDWDKLNNALENSEGTLEQMAAIQLDNLAGSFTLLASAWDAFQRNLVKGDASQGLRSFVDSLRDSIEKANELFKDGIQIGDFGKIAIDLVNKLKNKFLELDGIGSFLAGGALFFGLKKIASLALSVKDSLTSLTKIRTAGDLGNAIRGQNSATSSVATMNVRAGVVNLSGNVKGLNSRAAQNQSRVDEYYRRRQQITGTNNSTTSTTATSRFNGLGGTVAGAGVLAAVFGALDVLATKNNSEYQISVAKAELEEQKAQLKFLQDNNAGQAQIDEQLAKIQAAESHIAEVAEENRVAEQRAEFGAGGMAAGSMLGAVLGNFVPIIGPLVGSMIGGALGEYLGVEIGDLWEKFKAKHYGGEGGAATAQGSNVSTVETKSTAETVRDSQREKFGADYQENKTTTARLRHAEIEESNAKIQSELYSKNLDSQIEKANVPYAGITKTYDAQPPIMKATFADEIAKNENAALPEVATVQLNKTAAESQQPKLDSAPKFDTSAGFSQYSMLQQQVDTSKVREKFQGKDFSQPQIQAAPMWTPPIIQTQKPAEISATPKDYSQPQIPTQAPQFAPPVQVPEFELPEFNLAEKFESVKTQLSSFGEEISTSFSSSFESLQTQASSFGESFSSVFESIQTQASSFAESFSSSFESVRAGFTSFSEELVSSFTSSFETLSASASATFTSLGALIQGGAETAKSTIVTAFESASSEVQAIWNAIPAFFSGIFGGLGGIASAAGSAIASGINSAIGVIQGAWEGLSSWLSAKISALSSMASSLAAGIGIGSNAKGTASWRGGLTQVNEHGGELIFLPNGQVITPYQTFSDIAHNAKGTSYFEGGWSEVNEHGGEIMYLPTGTRIVPHATTVRILREEIKDKLNAQNTVRLSESERRQLNDARKKAAGFKDPKTLSKTSTVTNSLAENVSSTNGGAVDSLGVDVTSYNKITADDSPIVKKAKQNVTKYDELGNLQGVNIPEYNRITAEDSLIVKRAKQEAQRQQVATPQAQSSKLQQVATPQAQSSKTVRLSEGERQQLNDARKAAAGFKSPAELRAAQTSSGTQSAASSPLQAGRGNTIRLSAGERQQLNDARKAAAGFKDPKTLSKTPTVTAASSSVKPSSVTSTLAASGGVNVLSDTTPRAESSTPKVSVASSAPKVSSSSVKPSSVTSNLAESGGAKIKTATNTRAESGSAKVSMPKVPAKTSAEVSAAVSPKVSAATSTPKVTTAPKVSSSLAEKSFAQSAVSSSTYDEFGNLNGLNIPEYNKITAEDSLIVKKAKQEAQRAQLLKVQKNATKTSKNAVSAQNSTILNRKSVQNVETAKIQSSKARSEKLRRLYEARKYLPQPSKVQNSTFSSANLQETRKFATQNDKLQRLYEAQKYLPQTEANRRNALPAPSNYNKNDKLAILKEAQKYLPRSGDWSASYQKFQPQLTTHGVWNSSSESLSPLNLGDTFNQQLPQLPSLPRIGDVQNSRSSETNNSTTNSNSSVNFNFGGVNISNGLSFDEFSHKLMSLFTQGAANSVQF